MIRLAKGIDLAKKPSFDLQKKTDNSFRKPPKRKSPNSSNPLDYEIVDPQEGLVPLFNSPFYTTPDTPADPMDCNRYPDSPWCGENPVDLRPVGLDVAIVLDPCNFGVQFSGTLGFIKLPPFQIVYRSSDPSCQINSSLPISRLKPPAGEIIPNPPAQCDFGVWINVLGAERYREETRWSNEGSLIYNYERFLDITKITYPYGGSRQLNSWPGEGQRFINLIIDANHTVNEQSNSKYMKTFQTNEYVSLEDMAQTWQSWGGFIEGDLYEDDTAWTLQGTSKLRFYYYVGAFPDIERVSNDNIPLWFSNPFVRYADKSFYENQVNRPSYSDLSNPPSIDKGLNVAKWFFVCSNQTPEIDPPPPPRKECCKMGCCPDNSNLERLLRLLLKKIGSDDLPASVPKLLTKRDAGTIQIQNIAEFISYTVKQLDALAGKYPLEIKIKDADLTQEGNQEKKISLPNIAEALAEIMGILLILQSESNANLIATTNGMIEAGSAKQAASLAVDYAKGNAEYLGYKGKQIERQVPFTFKPGEGRLDKMLVKGEVKVKGWENDDKDDLNDALAPLLELAAMWKAANFKNLGTSDPLAKLKEILRGAVSLSDEADKLVKNSGSPTDPSSQPKKNEWDSFIEEAEQGFIAQPGITDNTNPYGRPLAQRPKIREIGNDTSDVEDQGQ